MDLIIILVFRIRMTWIKLMVKHVVLGHNIGRNMKIRNPKSTIYYNVPLIENNEIIERPARSNYYN